MGRRPSPHHCPCGETDPAKYVARLRDLNTSNQPVVFRTNMDAGHGGASGRFERLKEVAQIYAFLLMRAGMVAGA